MLKIKEVDIKIRNFVFFTMQIFLIGNCISQVKNDSKMEIQMNFYPSSGGDAIYSIDLIDNKLVIRNRETPENENIILSETELIELNRIVDLIKQRDDLETEIILDSWRVELIIGSKIYYNESDVRLNNLPGDIKKLFDFLIKRSTVKIDLYNFS